MIAGDRVGSWEVIIETPGKYRITLYRWHPASGLALDADMIQLNLERGGIPVSQARLKTKEVDKTVNTSARQVSVEFLVELDAGINRIETFLMDKSGNTLCSAYYTEVELIK